MEIQAHYNVKRIRFFSLKFSFQNQNNLISLQFIIAYLFHEHGNITEGVINQAEDSSPLDVDPVSGVYIGVLEEKETKTDNGKHKEFDKENADSEKERKPSISSLTDKLSSMKNIIQKKRLNKEWF